MQREGEDEVGEAMIFNIIITYTPHKCTKFIENSNYIYIHTYTYIYVYVYIYMYIHTQGVS